MKRLTTLALLVGALFIAPTHGEETSIEALLRLNDPMPGTPAALSQTSPVFIPSMVNSISIAQMGFPEGISLSGGQFQGGASFTLPVDQVITTARLALTLKISPAMAARSATMQLMLNGCLLYASPSPRD